MLYVLLGVMTLAVVCLNITTWKGWSRARLIFKMIASVLFVVIALYCYATYGADVRYFVALMAAFVLSFFGDFFLGYDKLKRTNQVGSSPYFYYGLFLFLFAQMAYAFLFMSHGTFSWFVLLIPVIQVGVVSRVLLKPTFAVGKARKAVLVYATALGLMLAGCTTVVVRYGFQQEGLLILGGGVLFALSDYLLLYKYFQPQPRFGVAGMNSITYYGAQVLFALSLIVF